jgi:hypothetical protein
MNKDNDFRLFEPLTHEQWCEFMQQDSELMNGLDSAMFAAERVLSQKIGDREKQVFKKVDARHYSTLLLDGAQIAEVFHVKGKGLVTALRRNREGRKLKTQVTPFSQDEVFWKSDPRCHVDDNEHPKYCMIFEGIDSEHTQFDWFPFRLAGTIAAYYNDAIGYLKQGDELSVSNVRDGVFNVLVPLVELLEYELNEADRAFKAREQAGSGAKGIRGARTDLNKEIRDLLSDPDNYQKVKQRSAQGQSQVFVVLELLGEVIDNYDHLNVFPVKGNKIALRTFSNNVTKFMTEFKP